MMLESIPPEQDWICRICLEIGTDTIDDRRLHEFFELHQLRMDSE